ncbi:hypothetical protein EYZ11_008730 [Aspergillus tanneri]|nr:hypothetical protein EYZ11_008730 [Aspergillus tanneri]
MPPNFDKRDLMEFPLTDPAFKEGTNQGLYRIIFGHPSSSDTTSRDWTPVGVVKHVTTPAGILKLKDSPGAKRPPLELIATYSKMKEYVKVEG